MAKQNDFTKLRDRMVKEQIERRGIKDTRLLEAMRKVPRHKFVSSEMEHAAYDDRPIRIGERQTISQPYIVALMTQLLELSGDEKVLEIGTGSGYQAAILGYLSNRVITVERHSRLAENAQKVLNGLGINNVEVKIGDGSGGWLEESPYDGIMVTAAAPDVPKPLLNQLADGGRLVLPVGTASGQYLQCWRRKGSKFEHDMIVPVSFVPLRGQHGFTNSW